MRFAFIATSAAAVAAVPLAMAATAPQMSPDEFLSAVRCTAYTDVLSETPSLAQAKYQLNAEARRQPLDTAAQAQADAVRIARQAVNTQTAQDGAILRQQHEAACAGAQFADGADGQATV